MLQDREAFCCPLLGLLQKFLCIRILFRKSEQVTDKNRVNLRFAHAETVIPFAALMGVKDADAQVEQPDWVALVWRDYWIAPMAANIQWIFYRDPAQRVWVQFLLNEKPVALSVPSGSYPYYPWEEVRAFFDRQITKARRIASFKTCSD